MLISIIIPVYNASLYIERCMLSALNQTYPQIEYILVDDCSSDDSINKVNKIIANHSRKDKIKIFSHDKNKGASVARNTGIKQAVGEYIYFMDSDDELPSFCIDSLVSYVGSTPDIIIGEMKVINGNRKKYTKLCFNEGDKLGKKEIINAFLRSEWYEMTCNKLINRTFLVSNNIWFKESLSNNEDSLWSFMLAINAKSMIICKKETYHYYINANSLSKTKSENDINNTITILSDMNDIAYNEGIDSFLFSNYSLKTNIYLLKKLLFSNFSCNFIDASLKKSRDISKCYSYSIKNIFLVSKYYLLFITSKVRSLLMNL
jgi:glycosyltransferase involved in cell wall biosynthesis